MVAAPRPSPRRVPLFGALVALVALAGVVESPLFGFYRIAGSSMLPGFHDGDRVLVTSVPAMTGGIHAGDVVIAEVADEILIKRVVGTPGDQIAIEDGVVWRNGVPDDLAPCDEVRDHAACALRTLGANEYFVLGDNRAVSIDSRLFGPLSGEAILAKVLYRFESGRAREATAAEK